MIKCIISLLISTQFMIAQSNYWNRSVPYRLTWKTDLILIGLTASTAVTGYLVRQNKRNNLEPFVPGSLTHADINSINGFDRPFAGKWDIHALNAGKVFQKTATRLIPVFLTFFSGDVKSRVGLCVMFLEGYRLTGGLTEISK